MNIEYLIMNNESYKTKIRSLTRTDFRFGVPEGIRTPDLLVRSQTLYPTELRAHHLLKRMHYTAFLRICQSLFAGLGRYFYKVKEGLQSAGNIL